MINHDLLSRVPLFSFLDEDALRRIAQKAETHFFKEGDIIIREDDTDRSFFIITQGEIHVIKGMGGKNEKQILTLGPYSFVGELALIDGLNRSASVVAKGDTEAISIEEEDLSQEIKRNPDLAYELLKVMAQKLRMTNDVLLKMLGTVEPICVNCNKIKDKNSWISLDKYVRYYSQIAIQHTICPDCSEKLFPQFYNFS